MVHLTTYLSGCYMFVDRFIFSVLVQDYMTLIEQAVDCYFNYHEFQQRLYAISLLLKVFEIFNGYRVNYIDIFVGLVQTCFCSALLCLWTNSLLLPFKSKNKPCSSWFRTQNYWCHCPILPPLCNLFYSTIGWCQCDQKKIAKYL